MPEFSPESTVLVGLIGSSVAKFIFTFVAGKNGNVKMVQVGTVTQLNCYPIKSCGGISVDQGLCTPLGLKTGNISDRNWVIVRPNGDFITMRQFPKMALIQTAEWEDNLLLTAPGMTPLKVPLTLPVTTDSVVNCRVWDNRLKAVDCGTQAGQWLSTFLQEPGLRLLWAAPSLPRADVTLKKKPWGNPALPGDQAFFSDYCSFLLATEASLSALNKRLKSPVSIMRFRPSIVISGISAFDEDNWQTVKIGDRATLRILDPCTRCLLTTVDPEKGERDPNSEPLNTLKSFRCYPKYGELPLFGMNATADVEGVIKLGDPVYVIKK